MKCRYILFPLIFVILIGCNRNFENSTLSINDELKKKRLTDSIQNLYELASYDNDTILFKKSLNQLKTHWDDISKLNQAHIIKRQGFYHYNNNRLDSAYFYYRKAKKAYEIISDSIRVARTLMNMSLMRKEIGDYAEAEKNAIEALKIFDKFEQTEWTSNTVNTLGNLYVNIGNYEAAKNYLKKAIELRNQLADSTLKYHSINNLGYYYLQRKMYNQAKNQFLKIPTADTIFKNDPTFIAMVNDNLAFTKLKNGENVALNEFVQPLKVRLKHNDLPGQITSYFHLSEYYKIKGLNSLAIEQLENGLKLAEKHRFIDEQLFVLQGLINLKEPLQAIKLANRRAFLTDSIYKEKYRQREKFTRIAYETEKKEAENLKLQTEKQQERKQKNLYAFASVSAFMALLVFIYFYRKNKHQKDTIETLQKELHHRVKNNLSIIDSFIEVTKDEFSDEKIDSKLTDLQNRIDSINEVHEQLYQSADITSVNLKEYSHKLIQNVERTFGKPNITVSQDIAANINISPSKSFPIGLIINEFITNSYKYAFGEDGGKIAVKIKENNKTIKLELMDDGKGLFKETSSTSKGFGLRIIKLLIRQLKGKFSIHSEKGVHLIVEFKKTTA